MPQRNTQQRDMLRSNFAARTAGLHSGTRVHTDVLRSTIAPDNTLGLSSNLRQNAKAHEFNSACSKRLFSLLRACAR